MLIILSVRGNEVGPSSRIPVVDIPLGLFGLPGSPVLRIRGNEVAPGGVVPVVSGTFERGFSACTYMSAGLI